MLTTIITGGQTGVDRAALDVAQELGIACGGWCPKGRRAEDGPIDDRYPLRETPSADDALRTEWNVRDADATLILAPAPLTGGTALTHACAARLGRPCLLVDPADPSCVGTIIAWLAEANCAVLNVAGPRQSEAEGVYAGARDVLRRVLPRGQSPSVPESRIPNPESRPATMTAMTPDAQADSDPVAHQGLRVTADDPQALRRAVEMAFSYRGDVKITRRGAAAPVEGYVYDRTAADDPARGVVRVMPRHEDRRITIPCTDIAAVEFTGRDTAEGRSFETWMKQYVRKKMVGERAEIDAEPL